MTVVDEVLNIRGYIGMPMLGQTRTFERFDPCRVYECRDGGLVERSTASM